MRQPEMILFDYGDTLLREPDVDFLRGERAVLTHAARNPHGATPEALDRFAAALFDDTLQARRVGFEVTALQQLRLAFETHGIELDIPLEAVENVLWDAACPPVPACLTPGVEDMLAHLAARGVRTGVVSNISWSGGALRRRIDRLLPGNRFEFVVASSDYGVRKPDARLFALALARAALPAEAAWYVGNRLQEDVRGAAGAGLFPVWYRGDDAADTAADAAFGYAAIDSWDGLVSLLDQCE